jgi:hypothetical protein
MFLTFAFVGGALFVLAWGRFNQKSWKEWEQLMGPEAEAIYGRAKGKFDEDMTMADYAYGRAFAVRELGSVNEAIRLLNVGYEVIEKMSPDLTRLLSALSVFSRMVSAMTPVTPLRPANFRMAQLVSLAYLNRFLHNFLVTAAERFRLRVFILSQSVGITVRFLLRSTERIKAERNATTTAWDDVAAAHHDFKAVTDESLESLKMLLASWDNERKGNRLAGPPAIPPTTTR